MVTRPVSMFALALLAGAALPAQVRKGAAAPELTIDKAWNSGPQSFADLAGRVVVLDFAQTW